MTISTSPVCDSIFILLEDCMISDIDRAAASILTPRPVPIFTTPAPSEFTVQIILTFAKGEHGTLQGKTVVDVKKNVDVDLSGNAPKVKPATG